MPTLRNSERIHTRRVEGCTRARAGNAGETQAGDRGRASICIWKLFSFWGCTLGSPTTCTLHRTAAVPSKKAYLPRDFVELQADFILHPGSLHHAQSPPLCRSQVQLRGTNVVEACGAAPSPFSKPKCITDKNKLGKLCVTI